jgi:imidazole glycerol-phosphate synthase subunit HisH
MALVMRIAICDAGLGNVRSVVRAIEHAAGTRRPDVVVTADPDALFSASAVVVPGQGSFGTFANALVDRRGLAEALVSTIRRGTPYLGICLGLQVLFEESDEAASVGARGLGIFAGRVTKLAPAEKGGAGGPYPLPHMGWNVVEPAPGRRLLDAPRYFYFAHSYGAPAIGDGVSATTRYGDATFASIVARDNVLAVQFHPEKSQAAGLSLLTRFFEAA